MKRLEWLALAALVGCARPGAQPAPPHPQIISPHGAYAGNQVAVRIVGANFIPALTRQLGSGAIDVDASFRARLGSTELAAVRWIDATTLSAIVPATLGPGTYPLTVEGPFGSGTREGAFEVSTAQRATLSAAIAAPVNADVKQDIVVSLAVSNAGGASAVGVHGLDAQVSSGQADVVTPTDVADLAPGAVRTFSWHVRPRAAGTLTLTVGVAGADGIDGTVLAASGSSTVNVTVPATLQAALSMPPTLSLGESFTATVSVTNTGSTSGTVTAALSLSSGASVTTAPSPATLTMAPGDSRQLVWQLHADANGPLAASALLSCTDSLGADCSVTVTANSSIADAALVSSDALGDGSSFSYVFEYGSKLYLGPRTNGTGAVRMNPDGSGGESVGFSFNGDSNDMNKATGAPPFPSLGGAGCAQGTLACGPDNEDQRGFFGAGVMSGTEWLFGIGSRSGLAVYHLYATPDTGTSLTFRYLDLISFITNHVGAESAFAISNNRAYIGFATQGGNQPLLYALVTTPSAPGFAPSYGTDIIDLGAYKMPSLATSGNTGMIDAVFEFNGHVYVTNDGGCMRATVATPQPYTSSPTDWADCTPTVTAWKSKTSLAVATYTALEPKDRAVPAMASLGGKLYLARNVQAGGTNAGAQLWQCTPTAAGDCAPNDWALIAANDTGDTQLSQFDNSSSLDISLLVATATHLYVGYDNANGAQLYRSSAPGAISTFSPVALGASVTQILDGKALTFAGSESLFLTARVAGSTPGPARVYRIAP